MKHDVRAKNIVRRVLAPPLHTSQLFELLSLEIAQGLRQAERDATRVCIIAAANRVGDLRAKEPATDVASFRRAALTDAFEAILAMKERAR